VQRFRVRIEGVVQGVGFRPFIYQLAHACGLCGYVANTSDGVILEVQGADADLLRFMEELPQSVPPLARITRLDVETLPPADYGSFEIRASKAGQERRALISPDSAICADCLRELFDEQDRRYRYPFINCTNCGPRYTIIRDIPYDRPNTTMAPFTMCAACSREYHDPLDRRFHAQPNGCWQCGPRLWLTDSGGSEIQTADVIAAAAQQLSSGAILAVKGLGGYHLAVDATQNEAVRRLRLRKQREEKPLALMSPGMKEVERYAIVTAEERRLLTSTQRPIVLLRKRPGNPIAPEVAPRNRYFGAMLPYTPLHYLLLSHGFLALVMTSGNISEEPIAIGNQEALERLGSIADFFLMHNRDILQRTDDSVVRVTGGEERQIRRSRGYVPAPIFLRKPVAEVLALGGELKGTICLTKENRAFVSQHLGDLENLETLEFLEHTVRHLQRILEISPRLLVHDLHPDYLTTEVAVTQQELPTLAVQHHHAHVVSCMAEHGIEGRVLGLALDGSGYGEDGAIWGGELLAVEETSYERLGHIDYVPLPGGEAAIKEPWRMAVAYLWTVFGDDLLERRDLGLQRWQRQHLQILVQMMKAGVNCPLTSSCGRLFDGVAALLGLRDRIAYEGQAAIELEQCLQPTEDHYDYELLQSSTRLLLNPRMIFVQLVEDIAAGRSVGYLSGKFHQTLVEMFSEACSRLAAAHGLHRVVCSGGVWQNVFLLERLQEKLAAVGLEVYTPRLLPANDGGISLGQAVIGAALLEKSTDGEG